MRATAFGVGTVLCLLSFTAMAEEEPAEGYHLNPGDVLQVSVWKEPELTGDVLVLPDGTISFPLVGEMAVAGRTPAEVRVEMVERLEQYVPDASVTVAVTATNGNVVFVIGNVARPGFFPTARPVDVMQLLSMAGGLTAFAAENKIKILRRTDDRQEAISFRYSDVKEGRDLETNILLQSGDVVVVP